MRAIDYISAVKAKRNITSTYGLGKALKVSKQMAGKYETGESIPGPVVTFRIAEILGEQPAALLVLFEQERAERDGKPEEVAEWKAWLKKIAGGAASVLLACGLGGMSNADARLAQPQQFDSVHIV